MRENLSLLQEKTRGCEAIYDKAWQAMVCLLAMWADIYYSRRRGGLSHDPRAQTSNQGPDKGIQAYRFTLGEGLEGGRSMKAIDRRGFMKTVGVMGGGIALLGSGGLKPFLGSVDKAELDEIKFVEIEVNGLPYYMRVY